MEEGVNMYSDVFQIEDPNPRHCYSLKMNVKKTSSQALTTLKPKNTNTLGFYFSIQPGPSPETLEWPMCRQIVLTIVNHANTSKHATRVLDPDDSAKLKSYLESRAPPASTHDAHYGYPTFLSEKQVASGDFLSKDGAMTFVVELKPK
jgi:hypothetical protein